MVREVLEITPLTSFVFALVFAFGIAALLLGLFGAYFGSGRSRAMGFFQMMFGWFALFAIYLFMWNGQHLIVAFLTLLGGLVGMAIALLLLLGLIMKA